VTTEEQQGKQFCHETESIAFPKVDVGVFAAGDVRSGSVKRCAAAVDEGGDGHRRYPNRPRRIGSQLMASRRSAFRVRVSTPNLRRRCSEGHTCISLRP
jgi:hypothetical protein